MQVDLIGPVVRKHAESAAEAKRLQHEAAVLAAAAHPGVVQLSSQPPPGPAQTIELCNAGAPDLRRTPAMTPPEVAGLGAALATTVADLHDLGISHRAIRSEHVLMDSEGRPILCGFGASLFDDESQDPDSAHREDVRAVACLLASMLGADAPRPLVRVLRRAFGGRGARPVESRSLARALVAAVPGACLPGANRCAGDDPVRAKPARPLPLRARFAWLSGAAVLCATVAVGWSHGWGGNAGTISAGCPPVDAGCAAAPLGRGLVTGPAGPFRLVGATGLRLLGRWDCGPVAYPALLDTRSGRVWVFDSWPRDADGAAARLLASVPDATGARVSVPVVRGSDCDRIVVTRRNRPPVLLDPNQQSR